MASNKPITVEQSLAVMVEWPREWEIEADDLQVGQGIVEALIPFVIHLHESGLSPSAIRRHLIQLGLLGSELIRDRHMGHKPSEVPPLIEVVDEEGGPMLHRMEEQDQRAFDATCRALHRFLTRPAGKAVVSPRRKRGPIADPAKLDALIAEATVDSYGDEEQASGFLDCFERIAVPFTTEVIGIEVAVTGFELSGDNTLVAVCRRGKSTQGIPVLDLRLPTPPPKGHEWIAAYRRWRKGDG
jgi:hypothetical protein